MALPKRKKKCVKNTADVFIELTDDVDTDPDAARKYRKIGIGFNKYEYDLLIKVADHHDESVLMTIRRVIIEEASRRKIN